MTHAADAQPRQPEQQRADESAPGLCLQPTRAATPPLCQNWGARDVAHTQTGFAVWPWWVRAGRGGPVDHSSGTPEPAAGPNRHSCVGRCGNLGASCPAQRGL